MFEYDIDELKETINFVDYAKNFMELEYSNGEWWGLCPFHKEKTPSFSIKEDAGVFYCQGCKVGGNIVTFTSKLFKTSTKEAIEKLASEYNIGVHNQPSIIKVSKKWAKKEQDEPIHQIKLKDCVMDKYDKTEISEWSKEGIPQSIMDKYIVRYDSENNRAVFPIWDDEGNIVTISGRTLDKDWKDKKLRKYTYYYKIGCHNFFYGYYQHQKFIEEQNEIIIFEGAKSVWKAESYGVNNCVASVTDAISNEQLKELLKIKCRDIVIGWDKGVDLKHVKSQIKTLLHFKNIYLISDYENLLQDKDSPVDKGIDVWRTLYKNKVKF